MIAGVPYDAEIEYLESTGTQWIDTGIHPCGDTQIECLYALVTLGAGGTSNAFWGCSDTNSLRNAARLYTYTTTGARLFVYVRQSTAGFPSTQTIDVTFLQNFHTYNLSYSSVTIDGTVYPLDSQNQSGTNKTQKTAFLFAEDSYTGIVGGSQKIGATKILENTTALRDFIPVRVGTTGYMYDRVSRKLFGNAGTGAFVLGPDVATPVMGLRRYPQIGGAA